jgi:hypothetical protein
MATVIPLESLRRSPSAVLFEGRDDVALSVFVTEFRGQGPSLHSHPYPEVFLVATGTGAFTVGDDELVIGGSHRGRPGTDLARVQGGRRRDAAGGQHPSERHGRKTWLEPQTRS